MSLFNVLQMPDEERLLSQVRRVVLTGFGRVSRQLVKEKTANLAGETRQQRRLKRI
jgi:hypothetical protein